MSAVFRVWNSSGLLPLNTKLAFMKKGQGQHFAEKSSVRPLPDWSTGRFEKPLLVPANFDRLRSAAAGPPQPVPKNPRPSAGRAMRMARNPKNRNGAAASPCSCCLPSLDPGRGIVSWCPRLVHGEPLRWQWRGGPAALEMDSIGADGSTLPFW